eukprot:scaffold443_cov527-Prasinococcus_capsulatus_cf.AAC.13
MFTRYYSGQWRAGLRLDEAKRSRERGGPARGSEDAGGLAEGNFKGRTMKQHPPLHMHAFPLRPAPPAALQPLPRTPSDGRMARWLAAPLASSAADG